MSAPTRTDAVDAAIVGGGLAGRCLALALCGMVKELVVVEPQIEVPDDKRTLALSESSRRCLEKLGVWRHVASRARTVRRIYASEKGAFGVVRMDSDEEGLESLGWTAPFSLVLKGARDELARHANVRYVTAAAEGVRSAGECARVLVDGAEEISARMVAVTAGDAGALMQGARVAVQRSDYGQGAVVLSMRTERDIGDTAYERFTAHGPMAVLPSADGGCAVVWVHEAPRARAICNWSQQRLVSALRDDFGYRLGRVLSAEVHAVYPLTASFVTPRTHGRAAFLSAGACAVHPVAAQGFNLALRDIEALAACLGKLAPLCDNDARIAGALAQWGEAREADARAVLRFTDLLARGFLKHWGVFAPLRSAAMLSMGLSPTWRRMVLRRHLQLASPKARAFG